MRIAVIVLALLIPTAALAQPSATPPQYTPRPAEQQYNPNTALALSLGITVASYAGAVVAGKTNNDAIGGLSSIGIVLGPSVGHWYSGHILTRGLGIRAAGMVGFAVGAVAVLSACPIFGDHCDDSPGGAGLMILGAGAFVAGSVDDIVTAPGEARRRNGSANIAIAPTIGPSRAGLMVAGRF